MAQPESSINVVAQIGQESAPGSGGATTHRLQSLTYEPSRELTTKEYTSQGYRLPTVVAQEMLWSSLKLTGEALYTEILYPLENLLGAPTLTSVGLQTKKRVYDLLPTGSITPKTNVIQFGDASDNVNSLAYVLQTGFGLKYDREAGVSIGTGDAIAQLITEGASFTASPAFMAKIPILGPHINYYLDTTGAQIGTTQILDEVLSCEWDVTGVKGARWVSDRAQPTFKGHVDLMPKSSVKMSLAESSVARGVVTNLLLGETYFLRVDCQGQPTESVQTVTISGSPTGGTFTLTYNGQTTAGIAFNALNTDVQSALEALSTIGTGNVTVTGSAGGPYTVQFVGVLAATDTLMTASGSGLTPSGTVTVADASFKYLHQADMALQVAKLSPWKNDKGVWAQDVEFSIVFDATWGHGLMVNSQTVEASL